MTKIALIGQPGSGKTSTAKILAKRLGYQCIDVDDTLLEAAWKCTVAEKLDSSTQNEFLDAENEVLLTALTNDSLPKSDVVLSLTGSNPMRDSCMNKLKETGWLIMFLDSPMEDILARLEIMKVNRIVGQGEMSMKDVLRYRQEFYKKWYDLRAFVGKNWTVEQQAEEIVKTMENAKNIEFLKSSRGSDKTYGLEDALLNGLAPDGGLYMPNTTEFYKFSVEQIARFVGYKYQETACVVLEKLIHHSDISPQKIKEFVENAYSSFQNSEVVPVVKSELGGAEASVFLGELFHGPSGSFKDLALQLTPQLVTNFLKKSGKKALVVVATSGDTGSAVLEGFGRFGGDNVNIMVMFPTTGVSEVQKQQMLTFASENVKVVAVNGNFDDCQKLVKSLLVETEFKQMLKEKYNLTLNTANSINWGRLLPQIVYHFHMYAEMIRQNNIELGGSIDLTVPSGNFGNMLSGLMAKKMGVCYRNMVVASNENKILTDFFETGVHDLTSRKLEQTISPAIDILVSSNLERWISLNIGSSETKKYYDFLKSDRMFKISDEQLSKISPDWLKAGSCDQIQCLDAIKPDLEAADYMNCPHTGVALAVAKRHLSKDVPMLVLATAHYSKFRPAVEHLKEDPEFPVIHKGVQSCLEKPVVQKDCIDPELDILKEILVNFVN